MTRKQEGWDLRSNLKNKPGAQGTLFSGGKDQIPAEKRYPRGYTPQRKADVNTYTTVDHPGWNEYNSQGIHPWSVVEDTRRTLARSSVPIEHMRGLRFNVQNPNASWVMAQDGVAGSYRDGNIRLSINAVHDPTVIHEVGHHVSKMENTEHSRYDSPRKRGEEEGYADSYADKHFVPLPKRQASREMREDNRRGLDHYEPLPDQVKDRNGKSRRADFRNGYDYTRPMASRVPNTEDQTRSRSVASLEAFLNRPKRDTLPGL